MMDLISKKIETQNKSEEKKKNYQGKECVKY